MIIREANENDIHQMQLIRNAVKENVLSNPKLITYKDYEEFLLMKGRGWVCEEGNSIKGFSIVDLNNNNIWALFVHPDFEKKSIGKKLHDTMLDWYFSQTNKTIWLSTAPSTRAEKFYRRAGWMETGIYGKGEIKFEMSFADWQKRI